MPVGHSTSQGIAAILQADIDKRAAALAQELDQHQDALRAAIGSVEDIRSFVNAPEHIMGSADTKHGEIAEHVEVGIRNAQDLLHRIRPEATFDGVGRTAPEDYLIAGQQFQSKFINGTNNGLRHVLEHMHKYEDFGRSGYYHIPKEQHAEIMRVLNNDTAGMTNRTVDAIRAKAKEIEQLSGRPFAEAVRPSLSRYDEVQQGRIEHTLDGHEQRLRNESDGMEEQIRADAAPGLNEALGAVGKGAAVGAAVRLSMSVYEKRKAGKRIFRGDYTAADWKDVGLDTAAGAAQGGIAAGALYGLTQYSALSAPVAGALVSTTTVIAKLVKQRRAGEITTDEFMELGLFACAEGGIVGLATVAGQTLIPVPVVGALIGSFAGRWLASILRDELGAMDAALSKRLEQAYTNTVAHLDRAYQQFIAEMVARYDRLGRLTDAAFDVERNVALRLQASVALAQAHGVAGEHILHNIDDIDAFMLE